MFLLFIAYLEREIVVQLTTKNKLNLLLRRFFFFFNWESKVCNVFKQVAVNIVEINSSALNNFLSTIWISSGEFSIPVSYQRTTNDFKIRCRVKTGMGTFYNVKLSLFERFHLIIARK